MNIESFIDRWRSYGPSKQLAILMAVLVKRSDGELRLTMSEIDDIAPGETVVYMENSKSSEIILRFSPEFTTLYTIEESLHERRSVAPWPSQSPASATSAPYSASPQPKTDGELAELEERAQRASALREEAKGVRVPLYSAPQPRSKGRTPSVRPPTEAQ